MRVVFWGGPRHTEEIEVPEMSLRVRQPNQPPPPPEETDINQLTPEDYKPDPRGMPNIWIWQGNSW